MSRNRNGTIYLLHFDQAVSNHARHYLRPPRVRDF
jgi:hypothetical protein